MQRAAVVRGTVVVVGPNEETRVSGITTTTRIHHERMKRKRRKKSGRTLVRSDLREN